ncbi:uncharacterized protein LOC144199657 [Stigmatopora nigra]
MKFQLLLPLTLALTVVLVVVIKSRRFEHEKVDKLYKFEGMKVKVNNNVLGELQTQKISLGNKIDSGEKEEKTLKADVQTSVQKAQKKKKELVACQGSVKTLKDGMATLQADLNNLRDEANKEMSSWIAKLKSLDTELEMPSAVCAFLKTGVDSAANKLCSSNTEAQMEAEPKAVAPKPEKPKTEAPKPKEPKEKAAEPDEPKANAPKVEAPKPQKPKAKAPKKGVKGH